MTTLSGTEQYARRMCLAFQQPNESCSHDERCFRRNVSHFAALAHPTMHSQNKPMCPRLLNFQSCTPHIRCHRFCATPCPKRAEADAHFSAFYHGPTAVQLETHLAHLECGSCEDDDGPRGTARTTTTTVERYQKRTTVSAAAPSVPAIPAANVGVLRSKFVAPPMSIVRGDLGEFQARTRAWLESTGLQQGAGRPADLLGESYGALSNKGGTSLFSPTLAELCVRWWCPRPVKGGRPVIVLDFCSGDATRATIAALLGCWYVGIDTSRDQISANYAQAGICAKAEHAPTWLLGDGEDCVALFRQACRDKGLPEGTLADFCFSCPPYWSLEVYDSAPELRSKDLSGLATWEAFSAKMARMIFNATSLLRDGHCFTLVTGNLRAPDGELLDMGAMVKSALGTAGCKLLNDGIFATPLVSAPLRAGLTMRGAKLCSAHQAIICATKNRVLTPALAREFNILPNAED